MYWSKNNWRLPALSRSVPMSLSRASKGARASKYSRPSMSPGCKSRRRRLAIFASLRSRQSPGTHEGIAQISCQCRAQILCRTLLLTDDQGRPIVSAPQGDGSAIGSVLSPGVYVIHVGQWSPDQAATLTYQLTMTFLGNADNPVPLVAGPAPAIQLQLSALPGSGSGDSPTSPVSPPPTFPGGGTGNPGGSTGTGPSSPFSPSTGSGPTATSGATGPAGEPASSPGATHGNYVSASLSPTSLTSAGLIALSVAPVG